jgi:hypothetical protein
MDLSEGQVAPQAEVLRGDEMRTPDEVAAMLRLKALGWGIKRIARELPIQLTMATAQNPVRIKSDMLLARSVRNEGLAVHDSQGQAMYIPS